MPNMNGKGPRGLGQMTGRGKGSCGCGQQRGLGRGRGYGTQSAVALSVGEQKKVLEAQLNELENEKKAIENKIKELN